MGVNIEKLISISSRSFNQGQVSLASDLLLVAGKLGTELEQLLNLKDGFYVFELALRIFSSQESEYSYSLVQWNSPDLCVIIMLGWPMIACSLLKMFLADNYVLRAMRSMPLILKQGIWK